MVSGIDDHGSVGFLDERVKKRFAALFNSRFNSAQFDRDLKKFGEMS